MPRQQKIAALLADGFQEEEFFFSKVALNKAGYAVEVVSIGKGPIEIYSNFRRTGLLDVDHAVFEANPDEYSGILDRWLPRLISGSMAAGTHGIIRCGHAARALDDAVTAPRLDELADALAYCAARYRTISTVPAPDGDLDLPTAMRELPLLPTGLDRRGFPPDIVKHLDGRPDFAAAVRRLAPPTDVPVALGQLARGAGRRQRAHCVCVCGDRRRLGRLVNPGRRGELCAPHPAPARRALSHAAPIVRDGNNTRHPCGSLRGSAY